MKKKDNKLKIPKPLKFKEYEEMDVLEDYNLILDNKITKQERKYLNQLFFIIGGAGVLLGIGITSLVSVKAPEDLVVGIISIVLALILILMGSSVDHEYTYHVRDGNEDVK